MAMPRATPMPAMFAPSVLARRQRVVALRMTALLAAMYLCFMLLVMFAAPLLAVQLAPGISVAILLGVAMIVMSWLLGWFYVAWANRQRDQFGRSV